MKVILGSVKRKYYARRAHPRSGSLSDPLYLQKNALWTNISDFDRCLFESAFEMGMVLRRAVEKLKVAGYDEIEFQWEGSVNKAMLQVLDGYKGESYDCTSES